MCKSTLSERFKYKPVHSPCIGVRRHLTPGKTGERQDMAKTIGFRNTVQVTLYECELKDQISDGHWENATPHGHWRVMCDAVAAVADDSLPIGPNFQTMRKYNFASPELLNVVSGRMLFFVRAKMMHPELTTEQLRELGSFVDCTTGKAGVDWVINAAKEGGFWEERLETATKLLIVPAEDLAGAFAKIMEEPYSEKQLKLDLREISCIVNKRKTLLQVQQEDRAAKQQLTKAAVSQLRDGAKTLRTRADELMADAETLRIRADKLDTEAEAQSPSDEEEEEI